MAVLFQTRTATVTSGGSIAIVMPNVQKGSLIVISIGLQSAQTVSAVSDGTNTYTQKIANTTNSVLYGYYSENVVAGNYTITITTSASATGEAIAREYASVRNPSSFDKSASSNSAGSTALDSTVTASLSVTSQLIIGIGATVSNVSVYTLGTGYKNLTSLGNGSSSSAMEDQIVYSASAINATFTLGGAVGWGCGVMSFILNPAPKPNNLRPHIFSPGLAR